ncbi:MAG TPA: DUF4350 domain-containing protein [Usitatibacter sp.]|nr:DUF4350 domain-containing protein [Usitatibacter sp.]
MERKHWIRIALVTTPLVAALLYMALNWFRIDYETQRVGATGEALTDRFLAYSRFLARMGARVIPVASPTGIAAPPEGATIVLGARRLSYMVPSRVDRLVAWVQRGGNLVIEAEPPGIDDPLLDALGIMRPLLAPPMPPARPPQWQPEPVLSVTWPGASRPLRVQFIAPPQDLRDQRGRTPLARAVDRDRTVALSIAVDQGRVTVLPTLEFLNNGNIGRLDHAELGWLVLGAPPAGPVLLFLRMDTAPLWQWIEREAWAVALAAALAVALWLARIIPRFGPLAPEAPPVRRSLAEHVQASGRYLWSRGEGRYLAGALRDRVMRAAGRRGVPPGAASPEAIARLTQVRESEVRAALFGPTARPEQFTAAAAALRRIEARLEKRSLQTPTHQVLKP